MIRYFHAALLFTCNDFKVILLPHTLIGLLQASTGPLLTTNHQPDILAIWQRAHLVALWNWLSLLTFNLANQRLPESVAEDKVNKPWRPIPSGLITQAEAERLLLLMIPFDLAVSLFLTGSFVESLGMVAMTWMYNDLEGGNKSILWRHILNGCAFPLHAYASTAIAASGGAPGPVLLNSLAVQWMAIEGCIVASTIHVMDLPDMKGDRERRRRTLPLVLGEGLSRYLLATGVLAWSVFCLWFWSLFHHDKITCIVLLGLGIGIAQRTTQYRDECTDEGTYKMWCVWLIMVYALPSVFSWKTGLSLESLHLSS